MYSTIRQYMHCFVVILSEITEKECVKKRYSRSKAKIRLVQHYAAISATAELVSSLIVLYTKLSTASFPVYLRSVSY